MTGKHKKNMTNVVKMNRQKYTDNKKQWFKSRPAWPGAEMSGSVVSSSPPSVTRNGRGSGIINASHAPWPGPASPSGWENQMVWCFRVVTVPVKHLSSANGFCGPFLALACPSFPPPTHISIISPIDLHSLQLLFNCCPLPCPCLLLLLHHLHLCAPSLSLHPSALCSALLLIFLFMLSSPPPPPQPPYLSF